MIPLLNGRGRMDPRVVEDPRWSKAQVEAMRKAASADPHAVIVGLDKRMRPVLTASLGIPKQRRTYALLRNGEPTSVTKPLTERWNDRH